MADHQIIIVARNQVARNWLAALLERNKYASRSVGGWEEARALITPARPALVIIDDDLPGVDVLALVEEACSNTVSSSVKIIVLSADDRPQRYAQMLASGVDAYVIKRPGADAELVGRCGYLLAQMAKAPAALPTTDSRPATPPRPHGKLISFYSPKGGNGTTTLCINLAQSLTQYGVSDNVLVADMVLPLGSVSLMVGAKWNGSIVELTGQEGPYDRHLFEGYALQPDHWNVSVLRGARTPREAHGLDASRIKPLFDGMRQAYDYVFADFGRTLSKISVPLMAESDAVVLVIAPDLVTVDLARSAIGYFGESGIDQGQLFIILNRAVGREGLTKLEIEHELGLPVQGTMPYAGENFTLTMNQKVPYALRFPEDIPAIMLKTLAEQLQRQVAQRRGESAPANLGTTMLNKPAGMLSRLSPADR